MQVRGYLHALPQMPRVDFKQYFTGLDPLGCSPTCSLNHSLTHCAAVDLLEKLLVFDPRMRLSAQDAISHPYLASFHDPDDEVM